MGARQNRPRFVAAQAEIDGMPERLEVGNQRGQVPGEGGYEDAHILEGEQHP